MIDETIISLLEEIDSTFSKINRVTREIKTKVEAVQQNNLETVENVRPWLNFFGITETTSKELVEDHTKWETSDNIAPADSDDTGIFEFDIALLPPVFQKEEEVVQIYEFIKQNKCVDLSAVLEALGSENRSRAVVFVDLLVKKRFVRMRNNILSI